MLNAPRYRAVPRSLLAGAAAIAACFLAVSGPGLAFPAAAAASTTAAQQPGDAGPVSVAITSVSPGYAEPGKSVTVSGTLTNTSSAPVSGLSVQLLSSGVPFGNRTDLQEFANGSLFDVAPVNGAFTDLSGTLAPHSIMNWSVPLNPADVPISDGFGVYPLAAEAENASFAELSVSRTFLPFWPNNRALDPAVQQISWIWPLIDEPRQATCPATLLNNGLASSLASGGRLSGLLDAGTSYASSAHLTWAIDPGLLASVKTMTAPYDVSGCASPGRAHPASQQAAAWLSQLSAATYGQSVFVTPYDDADIAALVDNNMNADLTRAFTEGRAEAAKILNRSFNVATASTASSMNGTAWPADGVANYADLENLAASDGINTVVLAGSVMPPSSPQTYTPSAQTTTPDGVGPPLNVLLSDDTITQILGSADSPSTSAAAAFSVQQMYLAETAMIAAEAPNLARSIVVAPPRRWDPPAGLASELLSETVGAPWLRTVSLSQLASAKPPTGQVSRQRPTATSPAELGRGLMTQARLLDQQASVLASLQDSPNLADAGSLGNAAAAVESSAWRGGGAAGAAGAALAQQAGAYLSAQERKVTVVGAPRVTLGGLTGSVPVSVFNHLNYPVRVEVEAAPIGPSGQVTVREPHRIITVPAGQLEIVKLQVAAATVGSTTLGIGLVTPQGMTLPTSASVVVQATHYGDLALIIIIAALAVLLLTAAARALRRRPGGRRGPGAAPGQPGGPADAAEAPDADPQRSGDTSPDQRGLPDETTGTGTVVSGDRASGQITAQTRDHDRAEATDDYAWAPGQAERR
jgi:Family of unknown function (DUF6049)